MSSKLEILSAAMHFSRGATHDGFLVAQKSSALTREQSAGTGYLEVLRPMNAKTMGQSMFAAVLGSAMLLVVLAAALTPNFGTVSAQSSCLYGNCTSGGGSSFPWTELFLGLAVILAALILAMLAIYYRRRKPPAGDDSNVPGGAGTAGGGSAPPPSTGTTEIGTSAESGPSYLEAARFFGTIPPVPGGEASGATAAWAGTTNYAAGSGGVEADLDSILAEIEKISDEILKRV